PIASDAHTTLVNNVPSDMTGFADARLLGLVFQNLISNAIKFTPSGEVIVGAQVRGADSLVQCWVRGTGAGIDHERIERILEKLETDQKPENRGIGLGLAIVKQLVELH